MEQPPGQAGQGGEGSLMPRRFGVEDEEVPVSLPHTLALVGAAYGFLKEGQPEAAEKTLGLLIGYLRGNKGE